MALDIQGQIQTAISQWQADPASTLATYLVNGGVTALQLFNAGVILGTLNDLGSYETQSNTFGFGGRYNKTFSIHTKKPNGDINWNPESGVTINSGSSGYSLGEAITAFQSHSAYSTLPYTIHEQNGLFSITFKELGTQIIRRLAMWGDNPQLFVVVAQGSGLSVSVADLIAAGVSAEVVVFVAILTYVLMDNFLSLFQRYSTTLLIFLNYV